MTKLDLSKFLSEWPHEPGRVNARRIIGDDGREKIQVRIDLGVLQMDVDGRPDSARPEDFDSLLEYQLDRLERYSQESNTATGFVLSSDECRALREEAVQYYHRYVALFAMGDYPRVIRDTTRNLDTADLCQRHAVTEIDRKLLNQFRPHMVMMRTRAQAEFAIESNQPKNALAAIDQGLDEIRVFLEEIGQGDAFDQANEVQLLRGMRDALVPKLPGSQRVELEERLRSAIDSENYELAAIFEG